MLRTMKETSLRVRQLIQPGDGNTKLRKSSGQGFETVGLSLAPHYTAGVGNTCPHASPGCSAACLDHQGLASVFRTIGEARKRKTEYFYAARQSFLDQLTAELGKADQRARLKGLRLAARLNVFSDIAWERMGIVDKFPDVEFYDYTKNPRRVGRIRPNYWVTFSRSELNEAECVNVLRDACNVAVVFADRSKPFVGNRSSQQRLPASWHGFEVIDGDVTDLRFDDIRGRKYGRVVGLRLKAHSFDERSQAIQSGFAVEF